MKLSAIVFSLIFIFSISNSFAQQEEYGKKEKRTQKAESESFDYNSTNEGKKWDWSKARMGGNFGLSFNRGALFLDISPTFGYKVHRIVEVGGGFKMLYYRDKNAVYDGGSFDYKSITYGPLAYTRVNVWEGVFAIAQYEMANKNPISNVTIDNINTRINVHHLLLGAGYSQSIGGAGSINLALLYDVIDDPNSNYQFGTFGDFPLLLNVSVGFGINRR